MKYLAAYALAWLGGKTSPSVKDLEAIVKAGGGDFDSNKANTVVEALKDKSLQEVISGGRSKLGGLTCAGAGVAVTASETKEAETKDDKKDEKIEDEDALIEGGIGIFDDDEW